MGIYIRVYSDEISELNGNELLSQYMRIATALERAGIDGIRIEGFEEADSQQMSLTTELGSVGEIVLKHLIDEFNKTNCLPTKEYALTIANLIQKWRAN